MLFSISPNPPIDIFCTMTECIKCGSIQNLGGGLGVLSESRIHFSISTQGRDFVSGAIRAVGWLITCFITEGWGMSNPNVLIFFGLAVLIETIGLFWDELCNESSWSRRFRVAIIAFELIATLVLLALCILPVSGMVSTYIGGVPFVLNDTALYDLYLPRYSYLICYFSPAFCAIIWSLRLEGLQYNRRKRTIYRVRKRKLFGMKKKRTP